MSRNFSDESFLLYFANEHPEVFREIAGEFHEFAGRTRKRGKRAKARDIEGGSVRRLNKEGLVPTGQQQSAQSEMTKAHATIDHLQATKGLEYVRNLAGRSVYEKAKNWKQTQRHIRRGPNWRPEQRGSGRVGKARKRAEAGRERERGALDAWKQSEFSAHEFGVQRRARKMLKHGSSKEKEQAKTILQNKGVSSRRGEGVALGLQVFGPKGLKKRKAEIDRENRFVKGRKPPPDRPIGSSAQASEFSSDNDWMGALLPPKNKGWRFDELVQFAKESPAERTSRLRGSPWRKSKEAAAKASAKTAGPKETSGVHPTKREKLTSESKHRNPLTRAWQGLKGAGNIAVGAVRGVKEGAKHGIKTSKPEIKKGAGQISGMWKGKWSEFRLHEFKKKRKLALGKKMMKFKEATYA